MPRSSVRMKTMFGRGDAADAVKTPNTKIQKANKRQAPNLTTTKDRQSVLVFGSCLDLGVWCFIYFAPFAGSICFNNSGVGPPPNCFQ